MSAGLGRFHDHEPLAVVDLVPSGGTGGDGITIAGEKRLAFSDREMRTIAVLRQGASMIPPLSSRIQNETKWTQEQKRKAKEELDKFFEEADEAIEEMERESERRKREGAPYMEAWKKAAKEYEAAEKRAEAAEKALRDCLDGPAEGRPDGAGMNRDRCGKEAEDNRQAIKALADAWNRLSQAMDDYLKRFPTP